MATLKTAGLAALMMAGSAMAAETLVFVGTYTRNDSKGIYAFRMNDKTGALAPLGVVAETPSPSFLAIHPNGKYLYAVNETNGGSVTAFEIDRATAKLKQLNTQPTKGGGPCFVSIDPTGVTVLVANYGGGSIASYGVKVDGTLTEPVSFIQHEGSSVNAARQKAPHAHSINIDAPRKKAIVADLGLDKVLFYDLDVAGHKLGPAHVDVSMPPGSGPRHFAMHPNRKTGYVISEMLMTMSTLDLTANPPKILQTVSTLPAGEKMDPKYSTAEVVVHPNGKTVYGSNRGHNTIARFDVLKDGTLKFVETVSSNGKTPRNFAIAPGGKFLVAANQDSGNVVVYSIGANGKLTPTGTDVPAGIPVCVRFLTIK